MKFHPSRLLILPVIASLAVLVGGVAFAAPLKIVAFGDSLIAGYGLARNEGFVPRLQKALDAKGHDVVIVNAGVSGDTTSGGRARLDWSLGNDADGVILELGANDMLRGLKPELARENLRAMLSALKSKKLPVLIAGMQAAPNLGADYGKAFNSIYPDLAAEFDVLLYPFFLDGVAGNGELNQPDGIHPTADGVDVIVERILPKVEALIEKIKAAG